MKFKGATEAKCLLGRIKGLPKEESRQATGRLLGFQIINTWEENFRQKNQKLKIEKNNKWEDTKKEKYGLNMGSCGGYGEGKGQGPHHNYFVWS